MLGAVCQSWRPPDVPWYHNSIDSLVSEPISVGTRRLWWPDGWLHCPLTDALFVFINGTTVNRRYESVAHRHVDGEDSRPLVVSYLKTTGQIISKGSASLYRQFALENHLQPSGTRNFTLKQSLEVRFFVFSLLTALEADGKVSSKASLVRTETNLYSTYDRTGELHKHTVTYFI